MNGEGAATLSFHDSSVNAVASTSPSVQSLLLVVAVLATLISVVVFVCIAAWCWYCCPPLSNKHRPWKQYRKHWTRNYNTHLPCRATYPMHFPNVPIVEPTVQPSVLEQNNQQRIQGASQQLGYNHESALNPSIPILSPPNSWTPSPQHPSNAPERPIPRRASFCKQCFLIHEREHSLSHHHTDGRKKCEVNCSRCNVTNYLHNPLNPTSLQHCNSCSQHVTYNSNNDCHDNEESQQILNKQLKNVHTNNELLCTATSELSQQSYRVPNNSPATMCSPIFENKSKADTENIKETIFVGQPSTSSCPGQINSEFYLDHSYEICGKECGQNPKSKKIMNSTCNWVVHGKQPMEIDQLNTNVIKLGNHLCEPFIESNQLTHQKQKIKRQYLQPCLKKNKKELHQNQVTLDVADKRVRYTTEIEDVTNNNSTLDTAFKAKYSLQPIAKINKVKAKDQNNNFVPVHRLKDQNPRLIFPNLLKHLLVTSSLQVLKKMKKVAIFIFKMVPRIPPRGGSWSRKKTPTQHLCHGIISRPIHLQNNHHCLNQNLLPEKKTRLLDQVTSCTF